MKRALPLTHSLIALGLILAGCEKPAGSGAETPTGEMKNGHPVVHLPPVETHPFEDGYKAGYDYGKEHAKPHDPIPTDDQSNDIARQQAAGQSDSWVRGFAEGYAEGVRNVVTGKK
jgi:hypothetical protein